MCKRARQPIICAAITTAFFSIPVNAADWVVSTPVIVNSGHETDRVVINTDIRATGEDQAVIAVNDSLGGIKVEQNTSIQTTRGYWDNTTNVMTPLTSTINIDEGVRLTGTIENKGYIRSGINVSGNISPAAGSALRVEGVDANNKAVVLQSITVRSTGYVQSLNDHTINIRQHGFVDFINIENNGSLRANDSGKSAVYVADAGTLGGGLEQQISNGDILYYSGNNADPVMNIAGEIHSIQGSGIKIDQGGAARGSITINGGKVTGSTNVGDAAVYIGGSYFGGLVNHGGEITGGIVVKGEHTAATQASPVDSGVTMLADGDRSAYLSAGYENNKATLDDGYWVLDGGVVRSENNHTFYLNDHSAADMVIVSGSNGQLSSTLESTARDKSAIYVDNSAELGNEGQAGWDAIAVYTGGKISSLQGTAIEVDGSAYGNIAVRGGELLAGSRDHRAIDFSEANRSLNFVQEQNGSTIGSIVGSTFNADNVTINSGSVDSALISGIEQLSVRNATVTTDALDWGPHSENSSLTVNTSARITVNSNFTLPKTTIVEVESGYDRFESILHVNGSVTANSNISDILIEPTSTAAYNTLINHGEVILLDYSDDSSTTLPVNLLNTESQGEFAPRLDALFSVTPVIDRENRVIKARVAASPINVILENLGLSQPLLQLGSNSLGLVQALDSGLISDPAKQTLMSAAWNDLLRRHGAVAEVQAQAVPSATPSAAVPTATTTTTLSADLNALKQDIISLLEPLLTQHDATNMTSQSLTDVHSIVTGRMDGTIAGLAFGDGFYGYDSYEEEYYENDYGPGFSLFNGGLWGQMIYNTSKHDKVEHDYGFKSTMSGFVLGTDTQLTSDTRIGGAGSWTRSSITGDHNTSATVNNYMATLYSQFQKLGWFSNTIVTVGRGKSDTGKVILGRQINASYESQFRGLNVAIGRMFTTGAWTVAPQAEVNVNNISFDAFEEKGSTGFERKIKIKDYKTRELGAGFTLSLAKDQGYTFRPSFSMMGYYDLIDTGHELESTYLAGGSSFTIGGPSRDRTRLQTGLGIDIDLRDSWTLSANYNLNWSEHFRSHNFSAKARYEF